MNRPAARRPIAVLLALAVAAAAACGQLASAPPADAGEVILPPPTGEIAFVTERDGNSEIYLMSAVGANPRNLTQHPADDYAPSFSPDGTEIAFASDRAGGGSDVFVMDVYGGEVRNLTNSPGTDDFPAWSPDGTEIAFRSFRDGGLAPKVFTMNADGTGQAALVVNGYSSDWSPDGTKIVFQQGGVSRNVATVDADGDNLTPLTSNGTAGDPAWRPDGQRIVYSDQTEAANGDIHTMDAAGSTVNRLTTAAGTDATPNWSRDGNHIAFRSSRDSDPEIYYMNWAGDQETRITFSAGLDWQPTWGPEPCQHLFTDVPPWVDLAVDWAACKDHVSGFPDFTFRPDNDITRAEVTRMLFRIAGEPAGSPDHPFTDVPPWVDPAVDWIYDQGFATGYPDNTYRPDDPITRAQTVRMNCRMNTAEGIC